MCRFEFVARLFKTPAQEFCTIEGYRCRTPFTIDAKTAAPHGGKPGEVTEMVDVDYLMIGKLPHSKRATQPQEPEHRGRETEGSLARRFDLHQRRTDEYADRAVRRSDRRTDARDLKRSKHLKAQPTVLCSRSCDRVVQRCRADGHQGDSSGYRRSAGLGSSGQMFFEIRQRRSAAIKKVSGEPRRTR